MLRPGTPSAPGIVHIAKGCQKVISLMPQCALLRLFDFLPFFHPKVVEKDPKKAIFGRFWPKMSIFGPQGPIFWSSEKKISVL